MGQKDIEELKNKIKQEFSEYYEIAGGKNYRFYHLKSVLNIVEALEAKLDVETDQKVLKIAALCHDIGRAEDIEDGKMDPFEGHEGHDTRGEKKVSNLVEEYVSEQQLKKVEKIIGNHHSEAETVEGKIVQDADKLSNIGVNNLWRQFHYACEKEVDIEESIEYFWDKAVDEYENKIDQMYFDQSKEAARKRLEHQKQAFSRIETELNAEDV